MTPNPSVFLVTLLVEDYDAAKHFFCNVLGFLCREDTLLDDGKRWLVVQARGAGGTGLLLAQASTKEQRDAVGKQTGDRVAFFLATDDFERDYAQMTNGSVEFLEAPRHEAYGTVAVFRDLCGNKWDLIQHR